MTRLLTVRALSLLAATCLTACDTPPACKPGCPYCPAPAADGEFAPPANGDRPACPLWPANPPAAEPIGTQAVVVVELPPEAALYANGTLTVGVGAVRRFTTPDLGPAGGNYTLEAVAGRGCGRCLRRVSVRPGCHTYVTFTQARGILVSGAGGLEDVVWSCDPKFD